MKTAILCAICEKPKKESESYAMKIADYRLGYPGQKTCEVDAATHKQKTEPKKVRVCRTCAKRMGYKVKASKKVVKSNGNV